MLVETNFFEDAEEIKYRPTIFLNIIFLNVLKKYLQKLLNIFYLLKQVIKDSQLIGIVCVLVSFDLLVLIAWEIINPLEVVVYNKSTEHIVIAHLLIISILIN